MIVKFDGANESKMEVADFPYTLTELAKGCFPLHLIKVSADDQTEVTRIRTYRERKMRIMKLKPLFKSAE